MRAKVCLGITNHEYRVIGKSDPPHLEEDSIFPDTLLGFLQNLSGGRGHSDVPRRIPSRLKLDPHGGHSKLTFTTETQPAIEPGPTSAVVTDSASTSNQAFDASDLTPSTSGMEIQPEYAMEGVEQTKTAHKDEEDNDV